MISFSLGDASLTPRGAPRRKAFLLLSIHSAEGGARAHMLDVSRSGARIHSSTHFEEGAQISFTANGISIAGRVIWSQNQLVGIAFVKAISDFDVERLIVCGEPARIRSGDR